MRTALLVLAGACSAAPAAAPAPTCPAPPAFEAATPTPELAALGWLAGEWEGTGWMQQGPGPRETFTIRERTRWGAGGIVLVIDGLGRDAKDKVVHRAFGVISVAADTKQPVIRAHTARGAVDSPVELADGRVVWGMAVGEARRVRFTITRTPAGEWAEVGEFSPDGTTWLPFLEMTLRRVAP
jgi:hypothetical protein